MDNLASNEEVKKLSRPFFTIYLFLYSFFSLSISYFNFSSILYQDNLGFSYGAAPRSDIREMIARMVKNLENAQMSHSTVDHQGTDERPAWVRTSTEAISQHFYLQPEHITYVFKSFFFFT